MKFSFIFFALCADHSMLLHGLVTKSSNSLLLSGNSAAVASGRGNAKIAQASNTEQISTKVDAADSQLFNAISLVAGTTVGAGILALPSVAIESGFIPSSVALIGSWIFMVTTGLLLSEVCLNLVQNNKEKENIGLLSMVKETLGPTAAVGSGIVYVFIHYALLVAYVAEAGDVLTSSFSLPTWTGPVVFTSIIGSILSFASESIISNVNNIFVFLVLITFTGLVTIGLPAVNSENLLFCDTNAILKTVPVMLVALVFHNIVPVICSKLRYDRKQIVTAITVGSAIPLIMFLVWNFVILGISSPSDITDAAKGLFDPVKLLRSGSGSGSGSGVDGGIGGGGGGGMGLGKGGTTSLLVSLFSEGAIITSFIGFVLGLMDFYSDLFPNKSRRDLLLYGTVLIPPTIVAIADPAIFRGALDLAGTFGISILFGIIPALMAMKLRQSEFSKSIPLTEIAPENGNNMNTEITYEKRENTVYEVFVPFGNGPLLLIILGSFIIIAQNLLTNFMH